jgi:hypothetical protein
LYRVNASFITLFPPTLLHPKISPSRWRELSHPCFPFLYPFSIFISSYPFCHIPLSPLKLSFFHSVLIATSAAIATASSYPDSNSRQFGVAPHASCSRRSFDFTRILVAALQWSLGFSLRVTTISYNLYLDGCLFRETHTRNGLWRERESVSAAQSYGAG